MNGACSLFSFDLGACVNGAVLGWLAMVPIWLWVVIALIVIGVVWQVARWPGLLALAVAFGYGAKTLQDAQQHENGDGEPERFEPPPSPPRKHVRTLQDIFRGN